MADKDKKQDKYAHLGDADLIRQYVEALKKSEEIRQMSEKMFDKLGVSRDEAEEMLRKSGEFDETTLKAIQDQQKDLEGILMGAYQEWKESGDVPGLAKAAQKQVQRKREKGKKRFLGQRKGWISLD